MGNFKTNLKLKCIFKMFSVNLEFDFYMEFRVRTETIVEFLKFFTEKMNLTFFWSPRISKIESCCQFNLSSDFYFLICHLIIFFFMKKSLKQFNDDAYN